MAALGSFAVKSFQAADALGDAADRAGVAVDELSRLKYVADQSDVEFTSLTQSIKRWQVTLSQASSGQKDAADSLKLLQLNAADLKGLGLEEQLRKIADQFQRIRDPADQTRVAVELFGRAGEQLVPLLAKGGGAIADLTAEAERLGITLDNKATGAIDRAAHAWERFKARVSAVGEQAAGNIALAIMGPADEVEAAQITMDKLIAQREMLNEAIARTPNAPEAFQKSRADTLARINQQLDEQLRLINALQRRAKAGQLPELVIPKEAGPITEVTIKQRKAELQGLAKLLEQFEQDTKSSEDKIYQDYLDTTNKIKALQDAGTIDAEEAAKRTRNARIKYESDVLIDPVKITQTKVIVQQVLTDQQRAVDKFVDTLQTGLENLAQSGEITGRSILKYLLSAFEAQVLKDAIASLGNSLKKALGGTGSSGSSAIGSFIGSLFGAFGHAAGGGRMSGPRIVGEDGPELDMGSGNILNRRQLAFAGGGGNITVNQGDVNVSTNASDPAVVAQVVNSAVQQNNRRLLTDLDRKFRDAGIRLR